LFFAWSCFSFRVRYSLIFRSELTWLVC